MKVNFSEYKNDKLFILSIIMVFSFLIGWISKPVTNEEIVQQERKGDMGEKPWVLDIEQATKNNSLYRSVRWTGEHMQMALMSIKPGEMIDLELHENHDQFIRIEQGEAQIMMGREKENLSFDENVSDDWSIFIPAGYWHQVINSGEEDLKLYTIYSPAEHAPGTINKSYQDAKEYGKKHH